MPIIISHVRYYFFFFYISLMIIAENNSTMVYYISRFKATTLEINALKREFCIII